MKLGVRELKLNLSRCLELAQAGEVFEITRHKRTVARLVGVPAAGDVALERLLATGAVSWSGGKPGPFRPLRLGSGGKSVSEMILEDRG